MFPIQMPEYFVKPMVTAGFLSTGSGQSQWMRVTEPNDLEPTANNIQDFLTRNVPRTSWGEVQQVSFVREQPLTKIRYCQSVKGATQQVVTEFEASYEMLELSILINDAGNVEVYKRKKRSIRTTVHARGCEHVYIRT